MRDYVYFAKSLAQNFSSRKQCAHRELLRFLNLAELVGVACQLPKRRPLTALASRLEVNPLLFVTSRQAVFSMPRKPQQLGRH
jgi:hypothetical protein